MRTRIRIREAVPDDVVDIVTLIALNTDYRTKRRADVGMLAPRLVEIAHGGFHRWLASRGRLGDQHKVPRVTNTRALADELLAVATVAEAAVRV